ncbi:unnamed protein product [Periconia digitata]|uniref:Uncharacterized protein n=1 Tax=Periconia digitata TaxID=1303443 RepID=A0A9W4XRG8_9PLEO|nr:unnamed protein product [Periconia digitata]
MARLPLPDSTSGSMATTAPAARNLNGDGQVTGTSEAPASPRLLKFDGKRPVPTEERIRTKPFDRNRPLGGGAERDIFRCFKIFPAEEKAFLTFWASKRSTNGFLSYNEDGHLTFHISATQVPDLVYLGICRLGTLEHNAQWVQVCDRDGYSWLTQLDYQNCASLPAHMYDTTGRPLAADTTGTARIESSRHTDFD